MHQRAGSMALALLLAGPIYQWVDEDGNRHFSDREPDRAHYRELVLDPDSISTYRAVPPKRVPARPTDAGEDAEPGRAASTGPTIAKRRAARERLCATLLGELEAVQDRLRRGYREPRGQQLRDRRRELRGRYRQECT